MRTEQLRYILEVKKTDSLSTAARNLYLSQKTLSSILKNVESELGFPLFYRSHKGMLLTPDGEEAISIMQEIYSCYEEIRKLSNSAIPLFHPVKIITSPSIHSALPLPLSHALALVSPDCSLEFKVVTGDDVSTLLMKKKGNIGLTYLGNQYLDTFRLIASRYQIKVDILFDDQLYLVVRNGHSLASLKYITKQNLHDLEIATLEHYHVSENSLVYSGSLGSHNKFITVSSITMIKHLIAKRNTTAIMPGYALYYNQNADNGLLRPLLLTGMPRENRIHLCLIYRADDLLEQEKLVLNCIREYFRTLPPPNTLHSFMP